MKTKRLTKILIVSVLILSISFVEVKRVQATALGVAGVAAAIAIAVECSDTYAEFYDTYIHDNSFNQSFRKGMYDLTKMVGLKIPESYFDHMGIVDPFQVIRRNLASKNNKTESEVTDEEISHEIYDMFHGSSYTDNSFTMSNELKDCILNIGNKIESEYGFYYAYITDIRKSVSNWSNGVEYNAIKRFVEQYQDNYYICMYWVSPQYNVYYTRLTITPKSPDVSWLDAGALPNNLARSVRGVNYNSWNYLDQEDHNQRTFQCTWVDNEYQIDEITPSDKTLFGVVHPTTEGVYDSSWSGAWGCTWLFNSGRSECIKVFRSISDMKLDNQGQAPYYVSQTWNDFKNSGNNTTYTIDNSNYSPVSYGDIISYNQQYYDDHSYYPTSTETQTYINNYTEPTPNPTDPNGNGGETVSGNGNGTSTWDFSWLGRLGDIIGALISAVGQAIAGIIEGIAAVITSLTESIPAIFTDFISALLGWLPPELVALVSAGVLAIILIGVIKLFK